MTDPVIAFLGYGEVARVWSDALLARNVRQLRAYTRSQEATGTEPGSRSASAAVQLSTSLRDSVRGAGFVVAAVPGSAIEELAARCAPFLERGAIYVDVASASPQTKQRAAALVTAYDAAYVDAAVMGSVAASGISVPIVASGPGAEAWAAMWHVLGGRVSVLPGSVGDAARLKLLRSVYMKGRDALIVELVLAARSYGLEAEVLKTIPQQSATEDFPATVSRVLGALDVHAPRRAQELNTVSTLLREAGVSPLMTDAAAERLETFEKLNEHEAN